MKSIPLDEAKQLVVGQKIVDMYFCEDSGNNKRKRPYTIIYVFYPVCIAMYIVR